ncbi:dynamin family protein [Clostridium sp. ZS2-4]|uniref:dynamin family protein n=1 Tax=Clostridium sp. ZS2-4 TaxID=2987703 RepID=UPI00227B97C4|nr:dynamin family protein [Clostridium sp. ZS2-4]MCY6356067.1 dynamin family protein [Clostridium sp. ZS2-4]
MISKDYKQNKNQVLALYEEYLKACADADKKVNDSIREQAEKIKNEIFNLMILGEAKSGKSTFINAYLGKEVVPMDVRQCTSAIIKIRKGDKFELIAKTAAGGKTTVTGYDRICDFLKNHAAISDKYRNIPITTINNELLIKYKGKKIPKHILDTFLEEEVKDNIFNMNIDEYNRLIKSYISENEKDWGKIITEIEITYQLPEEMQGITIIDSPGVGAGGNVGRIAEEYIKNANAIIFVKSLNGQALESSSFMNFLRNNCTNRKKESLFLVLTGKSNLQGSEFASLKEQAIEMYKNDIKPEKTIFVDSKMQLFLNKCRELGTEEIIDEFFDTLDEAGDDFAPASKCWLKSKGDIARFNEKMEGLSNFGSVQGSLEKFARVANYLQLVEFLDNLENEYKRYKGIYSDALKVAKENINDPVALEDRIKEKKKEISEVYTKITDGINEIYKKYTDNINGEGVIMNEAEKKQAEYEEKLENFRNLPESKITDATFSSMKKMTFDAVDDTKDFRREMADKVIEECNQRLIQYTNDSSQIPAEAYNPNFTESDFDTIDDAAKDETSGYNDVESGLTFKSVERVPYHHLKEHVKLVAKSIYDRLSEEIIFKMIDNVVNYVTKCTEVYRTKLTEHKQELEGEYQKLLEDKENNDKLRETIEDMERNLAVVEAGASEVAELKGELKNYVGE